MKELSDLYIEKDKRNNPLLLAASFNGLLTFQGSHIENGILYWLFSPKEKAQKLIEQFNTKTEPHIPARDIFDATATFWEQIAEMKGRK